MEETVAHWWRSRPWGVNVFLIWERVELWTKMREGWMNGREGGDMRLVLGFLIWEGGRFTKGFHFLFLILARFSRNWRSHVAVDTSARMEALGDLLSGFSISAFKLNLSISDFQKYVGPITTKCSIYLFFNTWSFLYKHWLKTYYCQDSMALNNFFYWTSMCWTNSPPIWKSRKREMLRTSMEDLEHFSRYHFFFYLAIK